MRLKPARNHESQRVIVLINFGFDIRRHGHVLQSMFYICHSNERYCLTTQRRFPVLRSTSVPFGNRTSWFSVPWRMTLSLMRRNPWWRIICNSLYGWYLVTSTDVQCGWYQENLCSAVVIRCPVRTMPSTDVFSCPVRMKLYVRVRMSRADDIKRTCADDTSAVVIRFPVRTMPTTDDITSVHGWFSTTCTDHIQ